MTSRPGNLTPPPPASVESLTFADLLRVFIEHRKLLWVGTLAGLVIGVVYVAFVGALYRSEAVLNLRYISFAEYKRYSSALADRDRFLEYAAKSNRFSDSEINTVRGAIAGSEALGKWIHPLFTITKADVKDAAETPKDANQFTGVTVDVSLNSRELADKLAIACGDYVHDFVMEGKIYDLILPGLATSVTDLTRKQVDILRSKFDLERLKQRRTELQAIAARYRSAERETQQRQVISTQDGGERYLSPVTQVIGVEAQIIEANSDLSGLERDVQRLTVLIDYYRDTRKRLESAKLGEQLAAIQQAFADLQKQKDLTTDAARDAAESIRGELEQLRSYNDDYLRMAGTPSARSQLRSIVVWAPLLLATLIGLLLSMLAAIVLAWWRRNASSVVGVRA
ncbi:MAG TPA: hypothetical protein VGL25_08045 [Casimicrobiaceae bacterium]|jgi:hypothetical protein